MNINNEELLMLDAIAYYQELSDGDYETIGNFIEDVRKNGYKTVFNEVLFDYTDEDLGMDDIIELIDKRGELKNLVLVYPESSNLTSTSSICLVDLNSDTPDVYVIYVGNYADSPYKYKSEEISTWGNNVMGAIESDTAEQKRQLDFYNKAIQAARDYLDNQDGDLNITVSGHSTGGNHAQYVTIAFNQDNEDVVGYQKNNDIERCVSFDGQGFSKAFIDTYSEAIENHAEKITSFFLI